MSANDCWPYTASCDRVLALASPRANQSILVIPPNLRPPRMVAILLDGQDPCWLGSRECCAAHVTPLVAPCCADKRKRQRARQGDLRALGGELGHSWEHTGVAATHDCAGPSLSNVALISTRPPCCADKRKRQRHTRTQKVPNHQTLTCTQHRGRVHARPQPPYDRHRLRTSAPRRSVSARLTARTHTQAAAASSNHTANSAELNGGTAEVQTARESCAAPGASGSLHA